jgi:hypothetical protein
MVAEFFKRMDQQDDVLQRLDGRLDQLTDTIRKTDDRLANHIASEDGISDSMAELVEIWRGSKFTVRVLSGFAAIAASIFTAWVWVKDHHLFK